MRWRSGLMTSLLKGTLLSEVEDTSILRNTAHNPPSLFSQMLIPLAEKPPTSAGYRGSDLVLLRIAPFFRDALFVCGWG